MAQQRALSEAQLHDPRTRRTLEGHMVRGQRWLQATKANNANVGVRKITTTDAKAVHWKAHIQVTSGTVNITCCSRSIDNNWDTKSFKNTPWTTGDHGIKEGHQRKRVRQEKRTDPCILGQATDGPDVTHYVQTTAGNRPLQSRP